MIYCIECDWQKMPKDEAICIMDIRGAAFFFFMFLKKILVFLLFTTYEFWFVFFMECRHPYQELVMELCFKDSLLL